MQELKFKISIEIVCAVLGLILCLWVNKAIPFIMMPNSQQGMWVAGFAQDLANGPLFNIYAHHIGNPEPAAMAFGLPGALVTSFFIRLGIQPWDAYTIAVLLFITIAYVCGYKFARYFSVSRRLSWIASTAWITTPVVWVHQRYSMLATSLMFLVVYTYSFFRLMNGEKRIINYLVYVWVCVIVIFMDGYGFMMFAVSSLVYGGYLVYLNHRKIYMLLYHIFSLGVAYISYAMFIGKFSYKGSPITFFAGWGADISFFLLPTKGFSYLGDLLGFSVSRNDAMFWGDASVWTTTFCLFYLFIAIYAFVRLKNRKKYICMVMALLAFWFAMGPIVKFFTIKNETQISEQLMSMEDGVYPTGNALVYQYVPGFTSMRACYRWTALAIFSCWMMLLLMLAEKERYADKRVAVILLLLIIMFNMPDLHWRYVSGQSERMNAIRFEENFVQMLGRYLNSGEKVTFLPFYNDFFAVYTAPRLHINTYNIGGDKNLDSARKKWPVSMQQFKFTPFNKPLQNDFAETVAKLLESRDVDAVVIHYVNPVFIEYSLRENEPEVYVNRFEKDRQKLLSTNKYVVNEDKLFSVWRLREE